MRAAVTGGREFSDAALVRRTLDAWHPREIAHGGARGLDSLAQEWARQRGIMMTVYHADWRNEGRRAGPIRNHLMLSDFRPDILIAFPGGRGTAHCTELAVRMGIEVVVIA